MGLRSILARLVNRPHSDRDVRRTVIHEADWTHAPRGEIVTELTETTIRANEGESWQPPPPARRDPWRPRSDHW